MIWMYISLNSLILLLSIYYVFKQGIRNNIPFFMCISLLTVYCLITPTYFYLICRETVFGNEGAFGKVGQSILEYYEPGLMFYSIANLFFLLGFFFVSSKKKPKTYFMPEKSLNSLKKLSITLFLIFLVIVLADVILSGVNPIDVILKNTDDTLFSSKTASDNFYFRAFSDSLITSIILYAYFRGNKYILLTMIVIGFTLFALMGFRYRIILTILGLLLIYFLDNKNHIKPLYSLLIGTFCLYLVFMISYNRWTFLQGDLKNIVVNPIEYDYSLFFEQTRGSLADFNLIRYYDVNSNARHDYGLSMFGYIFVRAIPKQFFENSTKPYPAPFIDVLDKSLELPGDWQRIGEASLHYGAFYAAFGWIGLVIFPFLMGLIIHLYINANSSNSPLGFVKQLMLSLALFQLITRGYFPQFVDHFAYLFIPVWIVSSQMKKMSNI